MKKIFVTVCLFVLLKQNVSAQDPHFSQFFSSPLTLSPAFTGKFDGNVRVTADYRNQWPTINNAFTTTTASVDLHLLPKKIPYNDTWGIGFMGYNDNSAAGAVNFNYFSVSTAYHKGLDEDGYHQLGVGLQVTYANMMIYTNKLTFEDQLTTVGFTGTTQDIAALDGKNLKSNYMDVNAGVLYSGSTNDNNNFYLGVSLYHINKPKQQFTGALFELNPRATIHAGGYFPINGDNNIFLHLSGIQTFQGAAKETVVGGALQFAIGRTEETDGVSVYLGSWARLGDAIIPYAGLEFNNFRFGATYDVNTSSLKTASQGIGGVEFSLVYIFRRSTHKPIPCPKF